MRPGRLHYHPSMPLLTSTPTPGAPPPALRSSARRPRRAPSPGLGLRTVLAPLAAVLFVLAPLWLAPPLAAQEAAPGEAASPAVARRNDDRIADAEIYRSLTQTLHRIPGLARVEVEVSAGVVRLSGETLTAAAEERALEIARQEDGVIEVIDEMDVTRNVAERLNPAMQRLESQFYDFLGWLPLLGVALVLFGIFWWLAGFLSRRRLIFQRLSPNRFVQDLLSQIVRLAVILGGALLALEILEATALVGAVLGTAGVLGLAVGFAFRDLAENYIASVLLSVRQPFQPNDYVEIDGKKGKVVRLTSRATILMTLDGNHLRIPNSQVFKGIILNYTRNPLRRFSFVIGLGVEEGVQGAQALGLKVLREMEGVLADPAPSAVVESLGDSTVNICFDGWVDQRESGFVRVRSEATRRVKEAFDDAGIDMPEPIYRVKLDGAMLTIRESEAEEGKGVGMSPAKPAATGKTAAQQRVLKEAKEEHLAEARRERASDGAPGDAIDSQIAADRAVNREPDLLDADAPQE